MVTVTRQRNRRIHEDTEPRLFYELLKWARAIKTLGWSVRDRRICLVGIISVYILQNEDFRLADQMRELFKIQASGVDY